MRNPDPRVTVHHHRLRRLWCWHQNRFLRRHDTSNAFHVYCGLCGAVAFTVAETSTL